MRETREETMTTTIGTAIVVQGLITWIFRFAVAWLALWYVNGWVMALIGGAQ